MPPPVAPQQAPDETGVNLAPKQPLDQATRPDPYTPVDLLDLVKEFRLEMRREKETETWRSRILASQKNELYYQGYQKLRKATYTNTWRWDDQKPIHYTQNEFQFWTHVNVAKWLASRADYRIFGLDDGEDCQAAANKLEVIANYYDDRDWTRTDVEQAAKMAMATGHVIAYVYYDANYKPRQTAVPVTERVTEKIGDDAYRCADCDNVGTGQAEVCEACGSMRISKTNAPEIEYEKVVGQQTVNIGDVTHQFIPIYNICWKSRLGLEKSPIVLWEEEHDQAALEARWPKLKLPQAMVEDTGLSVKSSLENTGKGSAEKQTKSVLTRMWVEPSRYGNRKLKGDLETVSGKNFPAGTPIDRIFPKGFHAILVGDLLVDIYETEKNLDLCVYQYHSVPNGLAQGVDAACEPQRQLNTIKSLINVWARHNALPPMQYVEGMVDPADISGDPTKPYPIQMQNAELFPGVNAENAVMFKVGQPLPPALFEYAKELRANLQFAFHATEFSEGLPTVSNSTATGSQIAQNLSQGVYATFLAAFADFRVELIKRKLKKFKRHCWDAKYINFAGEYGEYEGQYLAGADIPDQFEIEPVPDSWAPRSPRIRQANLQNLLQVVGGPQGLAVTPPEILKQLEETFDVTVTNDEYPAAVRTARMRIKNANTLLPSLQIANQAIQAFTGAPPMGQPQAVPVPQQAVATPQGVVQPPPATAIQQQPISVAEQLMEAINPPFDPHESGHGPAAEYLSRWMTTDEGIKASPDVRQFVTLLMQAHVEAQGMHNQVRAALAGQPMMPGGSPPPAIPGPQQSGGQVMGG